MGHIRHHAIVVTSGHRDILRDAWAKAAGLGLYVTYPIESSVNGYGSFFIAPDGSKENWPESDEGDRQRAEFKAWTKTVRYPETGDPADRGSPIDWVEIAYGSDDGDAWVVDSEWADR